MRRLLFFPLVLLNFVGRGAAGENFQSPEDVWRGYDPRQIPLEVEVVRKSQTDNIESTEVFFTALIEDGRKVRVYAIYSVPKGKTNLPGILHIHGGGQTVSPIWNEFWTQRGYAALTIDWYGQHDERKIFTDWGPYTQGNARTTKGMAEAVKPSPRVSSWYLWTVAARRALTFLEQQPEVDPDRLGLFGISMGGTITWYVAGTDSRVKAACAIYGAGWHTHPLLNEKNDPAAADDDVRLWRQLMDPSVYAPKVKCPILYLSSTNEHWGKFDYVTRTLAAVKAPHAFHFTPRFMHFIDQEAGRDLPMWMDTWLRGGPKWPANPTASVSLSQDEVPQIAIAADESQEITKVEAFYAVENLNSMTRYWRDAETTKAASGWTAAAPIHDPTRPMYAYANIHYAKGWVLSTMPVQLIPGDLGEARATDTKSTVLSDFSKGLEGWVSTAHAVDPYGERAPIEVKIVTDEDGLPALTSPNRNVVRNQRIGDPKWRPQPGARLSFSVKTPQPGEITVCLVEPPGEAMKKDGRFFRKKVAIPVGGKWQQVTLALPEFSTPEGETAGDWGSYTTLQIEAQEGNAPLYRDFRWE